MIDILDKASRDYSFYALPYIFDLIQIRRIFWQKNKINAVSSCNLSSIICPMRVKIIAKYDDVLKLIVCV